MSCFQSFWHGPELPAFARLCMASFIERGDRFQLYAYRKLDVPRGVELLDAATILPEANVFYYKNPDGTNRSVAAFANLFRYTLLASRGGWWVDTDVLRLDAATPDDELFMGYQDERTICTAILRAPGGHPLFAEARRRAIAAGGENLEWGQTGPKLMTTLVREFELTGRVFPQTFAYPTRYEEYSFAVKADQCAEVVRRVEAAPFLHLWHEMFRLNGDPRLNAPETGSFLYEAYRLAMAPRGRIRRFLDAARKRVFG